MEGLLTEGIHLCQNFYKNKKTVLILVETVN